MTLLTVCLQQKGVAPPRHPTQAEWDEWQIRSLNEDEGRRNLRDGIDCPLCANKGWIYRLEEGSPVAARCRCMPARETMRRMEESGLGQTVNAFTFENYIAAEGWQKDLKQLAQDFCADDSARWLYIGGQVGSGKTHLCTAVCAHYIRRGSRVRYMLWAERSKALKAAVTDYRAYAEMLDEYKRVEVLYIDDFLKVRQGTEPSDGDLNLAFELINARLLSPDKVTVISSEKTLQEAMAYDEATVSRIWQQCGRYRVDVKKDLGKNYRLRE